MSLQAWKADAELLEKHFESCDVPLCETCQVALERWADEYARDCGKKREEDLNGDEPWDFSPYDETYPSRA